MEHFQYLKLEHQIMLTYPGYAYLWHTLIETSNPNNNRL